MAAASAPSKTKPEPKTACGARTRRGTPCRRRAGFGTDHVGFGRCKLHAGNTQTGRVAGIREELRHMAIPRVIHPHDALIEAVHIAAGEVHYATLMLNDLEDDALVNTHRTEVEWESSGDRGTGTETKTTNDAALHVWARVRHEALDRMVKYSKTALDAGIAEREVRIAEQHGHQLAEMLNQVLAGHGITGAKRKPDVIRAALTVIEGGRRVA